MNSMLDAALRYASFGWYVFPCVPGTKLPALEGYSQAATLNPAQITAWWTAQPTANIGIMTEPSGLVVYDVDVKKGARGAESHATLAHLLTASFTSMTPSGGMHVYYKSPGGIGRRVDLLGQNSGIDLLGRGFVLAAPSVVGTLNDAQNTPATYTWIDTQATALAPLPEALVQLAHRRSLTETTRAATAVTSGPSTGQILEGGRNQALFKMGAALRNQSMSGAEIFAVLSLRNAELCRPPLPIEEIQLLTDSIVKTVVDEQAGLKAMREALGLAERSAPMHEGMDQFAVQNIAVRPVQPIVHYPTGLPWLDHLLGGGLATRQLQILASKPGAGKTALTLFLARQIAMQVPVLLISTETENAEIVSRLVAHIIPIPWRDMLVHPQPNATVAQVLAGVQIYVLDPEDLPTDLIGKFDKLTDLFDQIEQTTGQTPIVVVDYLQELVRGAAEAEKRSATSGVSLMLKVFARRRNCAVLAVSSVGRVGYGTAAKKAGEQEDPTAFLAYAKESGDIDYDAGTVLYIDMSDELTTDSVGVRAREGRIAVAKCRHGMVGFVPVTYQPARGIFLTSNEQTQTRVVYQRIISALREAETPLTKSELADVCKGKKSTHIEAVKNLLKFDVLRIVEVQLANDLPRKTVQLDEQNWLLFSSSQDWKNLNA